MSRHQDFEGVGNAITEEIKQQDLALVLELGATTVRLAHYQHDQRFYDLCDEAGLVVWAEIPQITVFLPGATDNARDQLTELIVQNRHHASIISWGLSNEITLAGSGEDVLAAHRELNDLAHELDPTRLTAMANLFLLETDHPLVGLPDVMSYNLYFGWYVGDVADNDTWLDDFHAAVPRDRDRTRGVRGGCERAVPVGRSREGRLHRGVPGVVPRAHGRHDRGAAVAVGHARVEPRGLRVRRS